MIFRSEVQIDLSRKPLIVTRANPRLIGFAAAAFAFGVDQAVKQMMLSALAPGIPVSVAPFFTLHLSFNAGVSFGLFADWFTERPLALAAITLGIALLVSVWLWRTGTRRQAFALGAIIGGALGNIADRLRIGAVVDYLDLHVADYHWPAFNLADAAIAGGVAILLLGEFMRGRDARENQP